MTTEAERARELVEARVPFIHLGRDMNGMDCPASVAYIKGYPLDTLPVYGQDPHRGQLEACLRQALGEPVAVYGRTGAPASDLQAGDIVAIDYKGQARHVAYVADHPAHAGYLSIIHTDSTLGRVTEHILDFKWLRRIREVYRT